MKKRNVAKNGQGRTASRIASTSLAGLAPGLAAPAGKTPAPAPAPAPSLGQILDQSPASDWEKLDPNNTLYMDLPSGRVIIALAPAFAPLHAANIRQLAHEHYFDGAS